MAVGGGGVSALFWVPPVVTGNLASWLSPGVLQDSGVPGGAALFANPTAQVGITAVNGTALTAMRSDAAPALDQTAAYAFSGLGNTTLATNSALTIWDGAVGTPGLRGSDANTGIYFTGSGTQFNVAINGVQSFWVNSGIASVENIRLGPTGFYVYLTSPGTGALKAGTYVSGSVGFHAVASDGIFGFGDGTNLNAGTIDVRMTRGGPATLQLGNANAASPVNQSLISQGSRAGTDTNVAGSNFTIASGQGTGNATGSSLIFQTPAAVASGTGAQTMTTRLTLDSSGATFVGVVNGNSNGLFAGSLQAGFNQTIQFSGRGILTSPAAGVIQHGNVDAASPVAQTLQAQGSRAGTDSNVAGAARTDRPGAGTGNAAPNPFTLQSYVPVASGTGAQTATDTLILNVGVPRLPAKAFTDLPATPVAGMYAYITDSSTATWGATIAGGGANKVIGWYNSTNWTVVGA